MSVIKNKFDPFHIFCVLFCTIAVMACLYPMYYVFILSISDPVEVSRGAVSLFPKGLYFGSYAVILKDASMWLSTINSVIYVVAGLVIMLVTCTLSAYVLTRRNLFFRKVLNIYLVIPMYFSGGMISTFILYYKLGLYNTRFALILPGISIWNIILTRTYFKSIPYEIAEAAVTDGANNWQMLFSIYIHLAKPVLAVISIYTIVGIWNNWFSAMIYLPNPRLHPLQMYLQRVLIQQTVDLSRLVKENVDKDSIEALVRQSLTAKQLQYSMIIVVVLPIVMVYPMFQKYFIKGVMLGSLKG